MTDPPDPPAPGAAYSSMDASRLLVQALAGLPPADRDKVYTWLLGTSLRLRPGLASQLDAPLTRAARAGLPATQQDFGEAGAEMVRMLFRSPAAQAQQMVPVRFSAEQHKRLRAWCTAHGFSMATVIRGLVDRFLDSQQAAGD
ncbi:MAG TPA: plasmid partition protein ParG [Streptosporangiaceae bacterium]|nr:plasmid partition protein ParG [Streptosporangiaceae bacterium]